MVFINIVIKRNDILAIYERMVGCRITVVLINLTFTSLESDLSLVKGTILYSKIWFKLDFEVEVRSMYSALK